MSEQIGWWALARTLKNEAPYWAATLPELPRLLHRALADDRLGELRDSLNRLADESKRRNDLTALVAALLAVAVLVALVSLL
jgi:ubiquinone biosynthesis protein